MVRPAAALRALMGESEMVTSLRRACIGSILSPWRYNLVLYFTQLTSKPGSSRTRGYDADVSEPSMAPHIAYACSHCPAVSWFVEPDGVVASACPLFDAAGGIPMCCIMERANGQAAFSQWR